MIAGIGAFSVAVGYAVGSWSIVILGAVAVVFAVHGMISEEPLGDVPAALVFGIVGAGLLALGGYAVLAIDSLFTGIVVLVAVGLPASLFLLMAWAAAVAAVTGERPAIAGRVGGWFDAASRPLRAPWKR